MDSLKAWLVYMVVVVEGEFCVYLESLAEQRAFPLSSACGQKTETLAGR